MDDGHLADNRPTFALGKITESEADRVCELVSERFGLVAYRNPASAANCQIMVIRAVSRNRFIELVSPHVISSMSYKVPTPHDEERSRKRNKKATG